MKPILFTENSKRVDDTVYGQVSVVVLNYNNKKVIKIENDAFNQLSGFINKSLIAARGRIAERIKVFKEKQNPKV